MEYKETQCSCPECKDMCKTRCWPSPGEARMMIEAGLACRMMKDYNHGAKAVCPASIGYGGRSAPLWVRGLGCVFFTNDEQCELHGTGYKPFEARMADCQLSEDDLGQVNLHHDVAIMWDSEEGRAVVEQWKRAVSARQGVVRCTG